MSKQIDISRVINRQGGAALIIFALLILITLGVYVVKVSQKDSLVDIRQTRQALADARQALELFATTYTDTSYVNLGRLPWPDRRNDGDYDGNSDCTTGALNNNLLLGRLPWRTEDSPCFNVEIGADLRDGAGERLWYAVSPNLVRHGAVPVYNPSLLAQPGWITVYDQYGNVLAANVAFVVIAPGKAFQGQNRSGAAPQADEYLDSFTLPDSTVINNYDTGAILDFVIAPQSERFNDQLIYVTINELMLKVEQRVLLEVRAEYERYFSTINYYPYAGDASFNCVDGQLLGTVAINDTCSQNEVTVQNYLSSWLGFINYEVRLNCIQTDTSGCGGAAGGLPPGDHDVVLTPTSGLGNQPVVLPR